ncbi:unnamed protein product [Rhizopus microsporus]
MDVIKAIQHYANKMIEDVSGMKALLLDTETTPIISLVTTQSALLTKECYLIDRIDNRNRDRLKHLKCICFLRPTREFLHYLLLNYENPPMVITIYTLATRYEKQILNNSPKWTNMK